MALSGDSCSVTDPAQHINETVLWPRTYIKHPTEEAHQSFDRDINTVQTLKCLENEDQTQNYLMEFQMTRTQIIHKNGIVSVTHANASTHTIHIKVTVRATYT